MKLKNQRSCNRFLGLTLIAALHCFPLAFSFKEIVQDIQGGKDEPLNVRVGGSSCVSGWYFDEDVEGCVSCSAGMFCPDGNNFFYCSAGHFQANPSSISCTVCPSGTYQGSAGASACHSVPAGYYQGEPASVGYIACIAGTYSTGGASKCIAPSAGYIANADSTDQTACGPGTYPSGDGTQCIIEEGDTSFAAESATGTADDNSGRGNLRARSYDVTRDSSLASEHKGQSSSFFQDLIFGRNREDKAKSNNTSMVNNRRKLLLDVGDSCSTTNGVFCRAGHYCANAKCAFCPAGYYCPGNNRPYECWDGAISKVNATYCTSCPSGTFSEYVERVEYRPNLQEVTIKLPRVECKTCTSSNFCPGGQAEVECPYGTYNANTGSKVYSDCSTCGSGQSSSSTGCVSCPAGYFCPGTAGALQCPTSTSNTAMSKTAVTDCKKCDAGTKTDSYDIGTACETCEANTFCLGGPARAQSCPVGTYSASLGKVDATSCVTKCAPGYYVTSDGTCTLCPSGSFCLGNVDKMKCPAGFESKQGGTSLASCTPAQPGNYITGSGSSGVCPTRKFCPGGSDAFSCDAGFLASSETGLSAPLCTLCAAGKYLNSGKTACSDCDAGYFCSGSGVRTACPTGHYNPSKSATSAASCLPCAAGKYSVGSSCSPCIPGTYCPGAAPRFLCPPGSSHQVVGATDASACSTECAPGTMSVDPDATDCIPCLINGYCAGGVSGTAIDITPADAQHQECTNGFTSLVYGASSPGNCTACPSGAAPIRDSNRAVGGCENCALGGYCPDASERIECPAGSANSNRGSKSGASCVVCDAGFGATSGSTFCNYCTVGAYCPGGSAPINCPAGSYITGMGGLTAASCALCPAGKYSVEGSAACLTCPLGSYCPGGSDQIKCPVGTASALSGQTNATTCEACPAGRYAPAGSIYCATCPTGHYCPGTTDKIACPAGRFSNITCGISCDGVCPAGTYSDSGSFGCSPCPSGSYCPGATARQLCSEGTFSSVVGASDSAVCATCPAGKFSVAGSAVCFNCIPGFYCPGGSNLVSCDAGYYSQASEATSISTCQACAAGKFSYVSSTAGFTHLGSTIACITCRAGQYCPGASDAVSCGQGFYSAMTGSSTSASCKACSAGYYSELNALGCTQCRGGTYCPGAAYYSTCAAGKYNSASGSTSDAACLTCAAGTYSEEGAVFCSPCPSGYYCPGNSDKILCDAGTVSTAIGQSSSAACSTVCGAGFFSLPGGTLCVPCRPGSYCPAGVVILCAAGKYAAASGAIVCAACEAGTYANSTGSAICRSCPLGFSSAAGATTEKDCSIKVTDAPSSVFGLCHIDSPVPTVSPTTATPTLTFLPTAKPTSATPTVRPTTGVPTTRTPTIRPSTTVPSTRTPTSAPSTRTPTARPSTSTPTARPTTATPSIKPSSAVPTTTAPTAQPTTNAPTNPPSSAPSAMPTISPSAAPSNIPSSAPSPLPSVVPSAVPSVAPTSEQSAVPSGAPSVVPSVVPTEEQSAIPSGAPSVVPSVVPTSEQSAVPSAGPSVVPSVVPTSEPSAVPSGAPSVVPSVVPTSEQSVVPSAGPSVVPSVVPTSEPSAVPSGVPSVVPSVVPTSEQSAVPSAGPSVVSSVVPTSEQSVVPSAGLSVVPSVVPTSEPSAVPSVVPTSEQSAVPSAGPSVVPSVVPTSEPSAVPSVEPTETISVRPSKVPLRIPTVRPSKQPTAKPSLKPTAAPSTVPYTDISFDASLFLKNISATSLDGAAQAAVCGAVTQTMGVADEKCEFLGQSAVGRRRLASVSNYQIRADVRVKASTGDFEDTVEDTNGDALYAKLTTLLETAVETEAFTQTVRDKSAELNAESTLYVGETNFTATAYIVVLPEAQRSGDRRVTDGEYAAIMVTSVFFVLVSVAAVWWCVCAPNFNTSRVNRSEGNKSTVATTASDQAVAAAVQSKEDFGEMRL